MKKCINPDCDNFTAVKKPRCADCRKRENFKCIICLSKVSYRALRCKVCNKQHILKYQHDRWRLYHKPKIKYTQKILTELHNGPISVNSLIQKYGMSESTIKNALVKIGKKHILNREFTYSI